MEKGTRKAGAAPLTVGGAIRTMAMLEFVADVARPVSGAEITRATGTNPSTAFNTLRTLAAGGYLSQLPGTTLYSAGPALIALSRKVSAQSHRHDLALAPMQALADRRQVVVSLWRQVSRYSMAMVAAAENEAAPRIQGRPNTRYPILHGSMGRLMALAGDLSDIERQQLLAGVNFERPVSYRTFMGQARMASRRGWSVDDGNVRTAITSVSVPVTMPGLPCTAVFTATLFRGQLDSAGWQALAGELQRLAALVAPGLMEDVLPGNKARTRLLS